MAAQPPSRQRHRARPGSVDRPVNSRMYRGTWLLVGIPLLVAAFSVARPQPLLGPALPPDFDGVAATQVAQDFANQFPDRSPGSEMARKRPPGSSASCAQYGFRTDIDRFHAKIPGRGSVQLENVLAFRQGRSNDMIAVIAHRDNTGAGPGANDNASGTAALLELAAHLRGAAAPPRPPEPNHTILFLSTDGGAFGGLGAARFAAHSPYRDRVVAAINLDSIAGEGLRTSFSGPIGRALRRRRWSGRRSSASSSRRAADRRGRARSDSSSILRSRTASTSRRLRRQGHRGDHAHLRGRPPAGGIRRHAQHLNGSGWPGSGGQPGAAGLARRRGRAGRGHVELRLPRLARRPRLGDRLHPLRSLLPCLAVIVDLFARLRRRRIPLSPALRSYRSRLAFWVFAALLFELFSIIGIWDTGAARPLAPELSPGDRVADCRPGGVLLPPRRVGWLFARDRLLPRRPRRRRGRARRPDRRPARARASSHCLLVAMNPYSVLLRASVAPRLDLASTAAAPARGAPGRCCSSPGSGGRCCCSARSRSASTSASTRPGTWLSSPRSVTSLCLGDRGLRLARGRRAAGSGLRRPLRALSERLRTPSARAGATSRPEGRARDRTGGAPPRGSGNAPSGPKSRRKSTGSPAESAPLPSARGRAHPPRLPARSGATRAREADRVGAPRPPGEGVPGRARPGAGSARAPWARRPRSKRGSGSADALEREQGRPDEELEADERRDRVPRAARRRAGLPARRTRSACPASSRRPRRPPRRRARPRPAHEIVRPDRNAAGGDEHVRREPTRKRLAVRGLVVGDRVQALHLGARRLQLRREQERRSPRRSVRVRAARRAGEARCPSRARRPAASAQRAPRRDPPLRARRAAQARGECRASTTTSPRRTSPPEGRMFAPTATGSDSSIVLSFSTTYSKGMTASAPAGTTPPVAIPIASPGSSAPRRRAPGCDPKRDGQASRAVGGAERETVHRRAVERRQVNGGAARLGEHPPARVLDRDGLGGQGLDAGEDQPLGLLDRDEFRVGASIPP